MTNPEIYKDVDVELDALFNNNLESKSDMAHSAIQKALYDDQLAKHRLFIDNQNQDPLERIKAIDQVLQENPEFPLSFDDLDLIYDLDFKLFTSDNLKYDDYRSIADKIRQSRNIVKDLNNAFGQEEYYQEWNERRDIDLDWLTEAEGLVLPKNLNGDLRLRGLISAKGVTLPEYHHTGFIDLGGLVSNEGLVLPKSLDGIGLDGIRNIEGVLDLSMAEGAISLTNLESGKGLKLPVMAGGLISLDNLKSLDGLVLPQEFDGGASLILSSLVDPEGLVLPNDYVAEIDLNSLRSLEGVKLPKHVDKLILKDDVILLNISKIPPGSVPNIDQTLKNFLNNHLFHQAVVMKVLEDLPLIIENIVSRGINSDKELEKIAKILIDSKNYRPLTLTQVADNLEKFPNTIDYQSLLTHLKDSDRWESIADNLEKFPEGIVNKNDLAYQLLKRNDYDVIVHNLSKFPDNAIDHEDLAKKYYDDYRLSHTSEYWLEEYLKDFKIEESSKEKIRSKRRELEIQYKGYA